MIPIKVRAFLAKDTGQVLRNDHQSALQVLHHLAVDSASEFGEFYLAYQGSFISPRPVAELLDIEGPAIPSVIDQTEYVIDRYHLSPSFLALTSDESEGMYLYNKEDKAVYDFDLGEYEEFISGKIAPRWKSFNDFLLWYFDESQTD